VNKSPTVYFSLRSPYSWLALERLRRLGFRRRFRFLPLWEPEADLTAALAAAGRGVAYQPMSPAKHRYILQDVKRLAERDGLAVRWPLDEAPRWDLPHLAWLAVRGRGGDSWALYDDLVAARWSRGADICDSQAMAGLLARHGLAGATAASLRADGQVRSDALAALTELWDNDIFGVPYFKIGFRRYWGYDRLDLFLRETGAVAADGRPAAPDAAQPDAERPGAERPDAKRDEAVGQPTEAAAPLSAAAGAFDWDTAGGCG
jgi:2-hydroxychromene-2-carboxylate isomerase